MSVTHPDDYDKLTEDVKKEIVNQTERIHELERKLNFYKKEMDMKIWTEQATELIILAYASAKLE